ncbi:MAG: tryptophan halogenase [Flammeovirgaceae bacterium]|nr:tryptophan halogenase [Flammeovirgaceae bacterium]|tara:strand:- start:318 stop:1814 length:1497 start_codon:yes stop_codon:yes gene_type:complete
MTDYKDRPINRVVIAGGGTAGWMTAAALSRLVGRKLHVTLVESEEIGTVGVGEATIPTLLTMNRLLQIPEPDFIKATSGTFKLGIRFENWLYEGHDYIHSFGDTGKGCWAGGFQHFWNKAQQKGLATEYGAYCTELRAALENKFGILSEHKLNYAYHLDATAYGQYLRRLAEASGTRRIEGQIDRVSLSETTGFIDYLQLKDGQQIAGDLFIDCTGFRALLIEDALKTGFDDWSHWLPCNRAWAVQTEPTDEPVPYTRAIAHDSGWRWRIPLQHRVGNGLVYCNHYLDDNAARERLLSSIDGTPIIEPRPIRFTTGQRKQYWHKNCIALGLSSGFIEPLESTSIHFIQNGIMWLLLMFPDSVMSQASVDEYNNKLRSEAERIRDFIVLHYYANQRTGEPFWDMCRDLPIPDSLSQRVALFKDAGRVFKPQEDVFSENSWVQVMMGQGIMPERYHNIVDSMSTEQLRQFLNDIQSDVERTVAALPNHGAFVDALVAQTK